MSVDPEDRPCGSPCPLRPGAAAPADPARRRFVAATLVASVGAFLAACGDGIIGGVTTPALCSATARDATGARGDDRDDDDDDDGPGSGCGTPLPTGGLVVTLASFAALTTDGGIARVDGGSTTPIAAVRVNATTYRAFSMSCTHAGTTVTIVGGAFSCPNHGAQFAATGAVTRGPATTALREYTVALNATAGTLTIT